MSWPTWSPKLSSSRPGITSLIAGRGGKSESPIADDGDAGLPHRPASWHNRFSRMLASPARCAEVPMLRKLLALMGLIVGCAGIGVFIGLGTYVWTLKAEVNQQTTTLASKANKAGDEADNAISFVREVIKKAKGDLDS